MGYNLVVSWEFGSPYLSYLFACLLASFLPYLLTYSLTHSLTHPLTHSLTHSLTHPTTHPLTHSLTHNVCVRNPNIPQIRSNDYIRFSRKRHYVIWNNLGFCRREVEPPKYVAFHIISSIALAGDTSKIASFDLGINVIFAAFFFWIEKLIASLKSTGKILLITFIPPYSTYRIH